MLHFHLVADMACREYFVNTTYVLKWISPHPKPRFSGSPPILLDKAISIKQMVKEYYGEKLIAQVRIHTINKKNTRAE